jgi:DNA-binding CsgD family transcriptional regulator
MRPDLVGILEACYRIEQAEEPWLRGCLDAAAPLLDQGIGLLCYTYESTALGTLKTRQVLVRDSPVLEENAGAFLEAAPASTIHALRAHATCFASEVPGFRDTQSDARNLGYELPDGFIVNGIDTDGTGCALSASVASSRMASGRRALWTRVAAHLGAGFRLQRMIARLEDQAPEAVLNAEGAVLHAAASAQPREARKALSEVSRAMMRARSRKGRGRPEETLPPWRPLVFGRWTLVEEFESDGKHFLVAKKNQPPALEVSDLSPRERQVLAFLALGQTNKLIAFELGISSSTVGVLLHRAASKLGVATRQDLIARYRAHVPPG